jgi:prepilin-type N-terminal cleavage/methylation domain-containing protein
VRSLKKSALVHKGFTLVELLVVIAIIAILAAVVVLIVNPLELTRRSRDAARFVDLQSMQNAINVAVQEATESAATILCIEGGASCTGKSSDTGSGVRNSDGTGWVKVDLSSAKSVSVPVLPVDPINSTGNHYTYCSDGSAWEINTALESDKEKTQQDRDGKDGGDDTALYEVGSSLELISPASGTCSY